MLAGLSGRRTPGKAPIPGSKKGGCRSPVSRILSIPPERDWTAISLTPPERSAPLARSATNTRSQTGGPPFPCYVLHRAGFSVPLRLPSARWALTPPFHPYLCPCGPSAVCFLLHYPSGFLAVPVPHFHEARCPVVSGLSSIPACAETATVRGAAEGTCALCHRIPRKRCGSQFSGDRSYRPHGI